MTWILVNDDGNESDPFDSRAEAKDQKQSMEQLGASVELQEVDAGDDDVDNIDAEIIEMSGGDGGNENGLDDERDRLPEPRDELASYRGWMSLCENCGRFSREIYRCQFDNCGKDLTNEPNYRGTQL